MITIPALFSERQIEATKKAAELAGLELKYLLQEPAATAIAYNYEKKLKNSTILIFDFGGGFENSIKMLNRNLGTLDISVIELKDQECTVLAVDGDVFLGYIPQFVKLVTS